MMLKNFIFIAAFLFSFQAFSQEHILRWGINDELEYFKKPATEFKTRIEKLSNKRIKVEIHYIKEPMEDYDHVKDLKDGKFDMTQELVFELEKYVPEFRLWSLPFLFETDRQIENYIISSEAKNLLKKFESFGIVGLDYTFSGGFIYWHGQKISSIKDLSNTLISLEPSSSSYEKYLSEYLNTKYSEDAPVLKEIISAVGDDLYKYGKTGMYPVNVTDHRVIARVLLISKKFYDSLPANFQNLLIKESQKMAKAERADSVHGKRKFLKEAKSHNIELNHWNKNQKQEGKNLFAPAYKDFEQKFGSQILLDIKKRR